MPNASRWHSWGASLAEIWGQARQPRNDCWPRRNNDPDMSGLGTRCGGPFEL
jgi:hypothetical protein